jgi:hypothetical protein
MQKEKNSATRNCCEQGQKVFRIAGHWRTTRNQTHLPKKKKKKKEKKKTSKIKHHICATTVLYRNGGKTH